MKFDRKNIAIGVLFCVVGFLVVFSANSYFGFQGYLQDQEDLRELDAAYNMGVEDSVNSMLSGIASQLNTQGYVSLTVPVGNSTRVIYLQLFDPNES